MNLTHLKDPDFARHIRQCEKCKNELNDLFSFLFYLISGNNSIQNQINRIIEHYEESKSLSSQ